MCTHDRFQQSVFRYSDGGGEAKQANATALGIPWTFKDMAVGDANGTAPMPDRSQTKLINEWRRAAVNQVRTDPANPNVIITEQVIPSDVGGAGYARSACMTLPAT